MFVLFWNYFCYCAYALIYWV